MQLLKQLTLFFGIFCVMTVFAAAQNIVLDVPPIGQKNSTWCWATSMEMVLAYHDYATDANTQYDLVSDYLRLKTPGTNVNNTTYCNSPNVFSPSNTIPSNDRNFNKITEPQFVDLLYNQRIFFSIQSPFTDLIKASSVSDELNNCQPFILFLSRLLNTENDISGRLPFEHSIVVKGKYLHLATDDTYLLANDPLNTPRCLGCEVLHPINILQDPVSIPYSALHSIRHIYPMVNQDSCTSCFDKIKNASSDLLISINTTENQTILDSTNNGTMTYSAYSFFIANGYGDNNASFVGISTNGFSIINNPFKVLTSSDLAYYLIPDLINGGYLLRRVVNKSCTPFIGKTLRFVPQGSDTSLDFGPGDYGMTEFLPSAQQYYRVIYKEEPYLSPIHPYPGLKFKVGVLYPEKEVLRVYKRQARRDNQTLKKRLKESFHKDMRQLKP